MRSLDAAEVSVVLVTVPSEEVGRQIATAVVGEGLAACVNIVPGVRSIFHWEGRLEDEPELLLLIKARTDRLGPLEARVRALHPYAVPEFIALPVTEGHRPYLDWVGGHATTRGGGGPDEE